MHVLMDGQMTCDFMSFSKVPGQWMNDNERLCAMEPSLQSRRFCLALERSSTLGLLDQ